MYAKKFFGYKTFSLVYIHNNRNLSKSQGEIRYLIWRKYPVLHSEKPLVFGYFVVWSFGVFGIVFYTFLAIKLYSKTNLVFCIPPGGHFDCGLIYKTLVVMDKGLTKSLNLTFSSGGRGPPAGGYEGSILGSQHAAGVDDGTAGAVDGAHAAAEALCVVDDSDIVHDLDGAGGTNLLTHAAADAADFTDAAGILALVLVGALDNDVVGALVDVDQVLGAVGSALAAGDALLLVDLGNAQIVDGDCAELTGNDTLLAADAAVDALCVGGLAGAAAAVTGDNSGLIGELLLDSHCFFPLLTYYRACRGWAGCNGARRRAGSKPR